MPHVGRRRGLGIRQESAFVADSKVELNHEETPRRVEDLCVGLKVYVFSSSAKRLEPAEVMDLNPEKRSAKVRCADGYVDTVTYFEVPAQ